MKNPSLETALQTTVRMLSDKYNIELVFEGEQAYTDGRKIVIPSLPSDLSEDALTEINGYCDHEVAHCNFTDFPFLNRKGYLNELHKLMLNMAEDSRIEPLQINKYPGTKLHLDFINGKWGKINTSRWKDLPAGFRIVSNVRFIMEDCPLRLDDDIKAAFSDKVRALCLMLKLADNTKETWETCRQIVKEMLTALEEAKENSPNEEDSKEEGSASESEDGRGKEEEEDSEGKTEGGGDADSEAEGEGSVTSNELLDPGHYETDIPTDIHSYIAKRIKEILEETAKENEEVFSMVLPESEIATKGRHLASTNTHDVLVDHTKFRHASYAKLAAKVRALASKVANEIEQILTVEANERWTYEHEDGRINKRALTRVVTTPGYSTPFKRKKINDVRDACVGIVVDESGSMGGDGKIDTARETCAVMAEALKTLNIPFEVGGFTTEGNQISASEAHNRLEGLRHLLYKSFDTDNLQGLTLMSAQNNNCDGESVRFFGERLLQHKAARKIMFVMSDGYPSARCRSRALLSKDLKDAVQEMEACGIEVVAFGIDSDAVSNFYPRHVIVNDINDLPKIVAAELRRILTLED